jgi:5-methylcytosine-specific restriction endonuclease McrA
MELRPALMPGCVLLPYDTAAGHCRACGENLPNANRTWCSVDCRLMYERNHYWRAARHAAAARDGFTCLKCGWGEGEFYEHGQMVFWSRPMLTGRGPDNWIEVNHIVPRAGEGYGTGCGHHQSNLETLCHRCHVKVTRMQRVARARRKAG